MIRNLEDIKEIRIESGNKMAFLRSELKGEAGKAFQAAGVAVPPTVRINNNNSDDTP